MKKVIFYITIVLTIFIGLGYAKPVFALSINTPKITNVSYVNENEVKLYYYTSNANTSYKVQIKNLTTGKSYVTEVNTTSYNVKDLTFGKTYNFEMRVYYKTLAKTYVSDWSNVVSATPRANAPTISSISAADKVLTINYKVTGTPKGVQIYNYNAKNIVSTTNLTSYNYTGLTNGTKYKFIIRNYYDNSIYGPWSNPIEGTPNTNQSSQTTTNANVSYVPCSGKIGQAASGNNGSKNGKGDNTGKEVAISKWSYSKSASSYKHWDVVVRLKDPAKANKAADIMTAACKNNYVGYDNRTKSKSLSFYYAAKAVNWDVSKIKKACYTACSQLALACVYGSGIHVNTYKNAVGTYNELHSSKYKNYFYFYTDKSYTSSYKKLMRGDILISYKTGNHHVAMAL